MQITKGTRRCMNSVYQALFLLPPHKSLGMTGNEAVLLVIYLCLLRLRVIVTLGHYLL